MLLAALSDVDPGLCDVGISVLRKGFAKEHVVPSVLCAVKHLDLPE
jgi:hypothetical protein